MRMAKVVRMAVLMYSCSALAAHGACNAATVQGSYAAQFAGVYQYDGISSIGIGRLEFDGVNKIKLFGGKEGAAGEVGSYIGAGKYKLLSNCQGTANLTLYVNGVATDEVTLDLVVSGTSDRPTIMMLVSNLAEGYTGQAVLQKISL